MRDRGQEDDWFHSHLIVTFATIAAASFIFFIVWELTEEDPIIAMACSAADSSACPS